VSDPTRRFAFVQLDFPGLVGLQDGRYLVRDHMGEAREVLVVGNLGAPPARRRLARRARPTPADPGAGPPHVPLTRLTIVRPEPLGDEVEAARWLEGTARDAESQAALVAEAIAVVNRAVHAYRLAAQEASGGDLSADRAVAIRIGHGSGGRLVDGAYEAAIELPLEVSRRRRSEVLYPQERVAAVLGGHEELRASETLLLRARADLDQGRAREAALQLRAGLAALLAELGPDAPTEQHKDLDALAERREAVERAANAAAAGPPPAELLTEADETLALCERIVRRRRVLER
jgi:hypothetical protein